MKVLIACEESQAVCIAFRNLGIEAYSCDIQPCSGGHPEWHIQGDVLEIINNGWDLMIGHPPCTYLSYAGIRWWNRPGRLENRLEALSFFAKLWLAPIKRICLENPRGCASPTIAKYTQEINPYYFGDEATKPTWLWLKNLPPLKHTKEDGLFYKKTHVGKGEMIELSIKPNGKIQYGSKWYHEAFSLPKEERAKLRSKTFPGIAKAMAEQWGKLIKEGQ